MKKETGRDLRQANWHTLRNRICPRGFEHRCTMIHEYARVLYHWATDAPPYVLTWNESLDDCDTVSLLIVSQLDLLIYIATLYMLVFLQS